MAVSTQNLRVNLNDVEILKGISMTADSNKFVGIVGPNGSGKSTLLKCLYRVLKSERNTVFLNGKPLESYSIRESARELGVVAQHNESGFDFNVLEMTLMGRSPHKKILERDNIQDYEITQSALKTVGMEGFEERSFATLSGGERQRVILARALAQQAPTIILDEPTNHLDIKYQLQLMRVIKESERTVIAAIHDLNIATMYCDYIYALSDGCIFAHGKPKEVFTEELIWKIYGVKATLFHDVEGMHIAFREQ